MGMTRLKFIHFAGIVVTASIAAIMLQNEASATETEIAKCSILMEQWGYSFSNSMQYCLCMDTVILIRQRGDKSLANREMKRCDSYLN